MSLIAVLAAIGTVPPARAADSIVYAYDNQGRVATAGYTTSTGMVIKT